MCTHVNDKPVPGKAITLNYQFMFAHLISEVSAGQANLVKQTQV